MWNAEYKSLQGNIGFGMAIAYFTSQNIAVSIPLNDTQKYDLVIELDGKLNKVQVKTTAFKEKNFVVQLKNSGGSSGKSVIRNFDNTSCDYLFILTSEQSMYLIPSSEVTTKSVITLNESREKYKVRM